MSNIYRARFFVTKDISQIVEMDKVKLELMIRKKLIALHSKDMYENMTITEKNDDSRDMKIFESSVAIMPVEEYKELKLIEKEFYRLTELLGRNTREDDSNE